MADHDQLDENLRAMAEPFTDKDDKLLTQQMAYISPMYCRMCGCCGGVCDKGVPVPEVLRDLTYVEGYGQFALAREKFLELPEHVRGIRCRTALLLGELPQRRPGAPSRDPRPGDAGISTAPVILYAESHQAGARRGWTVESR